MNSVSRYLSTLVAGIITPDHPARLMSTVLLLLLPGCAWMTPSLSSGVGADAADYHATISDFNDSILVANIIRARDRVPLNITELSTVTGTLSEQASAMLTAPFGGNYGTTPRGAGTIMAQAGSTPTFSMAALNTEGFTLNILQPIPPMYVLSKWNSGISRELLLLLFIKDIQFPDTFGDPILDKDGHEILDSTGNVLLTRVHHKYLNDPDLPEQEAAFLLLLRALMKTVTMSSLNVLEPVGTTFTFAIPSNAGSTAANPLTAFAWLTSLGDASYHVGNSDNTGTGGQLYRQYSSQVALCAEDTLPDGVTLFTSAVLAQVRKVQSARDTRIANQCTSGGTLDTSCVSDHSPFLEQQSNELNAFVLRGLISSVSSFGPGSSASGPTGSTTPPAASPAASHAVAGASSGTGASGTAVTSIMQLNRLSAILSPNACRSQQLVLPIASENELRANTEGFSRIEWRSIAEVFQYLGAVARNGYNVSWSSLDDIDTTVQGSQAAIRANRNRQELVFALRSSGTIRGNYRAENSWVANTPLLTTNAIYTDHSLEVLSLISELVNSAKVSSDIPVTQQLQVVP